MSIKLKNRYDEARKNVKHYDFEDDLMSAIKRGDKHRVTRLLSNVEIASSFKLSNDSRYANTAIELGYPNILRMLVDHGAILYPRGANQPNSMFNLCQIGDPRMLSALLSPLNIAGGAELINSKFDIEYTLTTLFMHLRCAVRTLDGEDYSNRVLMLRTFLDTVYSLSFEINLDTMAHQLKTLLDLGEKEVSTYLQRIFPLVKNIFMRKYNITIQDYTSEKIGLKFFGGKNVVLALEQREMTYRPRFSRRSKRIIDEEHVSEAASSSSSSGSPTSASRPSSPGS